MKKSTKIIIAIVAILIIIAIIVAIFIFSGSNKEGSSNNETGGTTVQTSNLGEINGTDDLNNIINNIYAGKEDILPSSISQMDIDLTDATSVKSYTSLETGESFEYLVVSEPMISSIPYSLVIGKVKSGVSADEVAKYMFDNIDARKWICVAADKVYATSCGDVAFFIMSSEEMAKPVYESFKSLAGTVGREYEKTNEEGELPPDTEPIAPIPANEEQ